MWCIATNQILVKTPEPHEKYPALIEMKTVVKKSIPALIETKSVIKKACVLIETKTVVKKALCTNRNEKGCQGQSNLQMVWRYMDKTLYIWLVTNYMINK